MSKDNYYFLVSGVGYGSTELTSFDAALMDAGIGDFNLVRMSSILPPGFLPSRLVKPRSPDGLSIIASHDEFIVSKKGDMMPIAYSSISSKYNEPDPEILRRTSLMSSSVAVGIPKDPTRCGLIMEYHSYSPGRTSLECVENMVKEGMSSRGRDLENIFGIYSEVSFQGDKKGEWATSFSGIVLVGLDSVSALSGKIFGYH